MTGFKFGSQEIDLSGRIVASTTVVASPSAATETIIASVTLPGGLSYATGVIVVCWAAFTVGTAGVSTRLRVKQTITSGTAVADSGALTATATDLYAVSAVGLATAPADGQVYKGTLTVASATAASTVSAVCLVAVAV